MRFKAVIFDLDGTIADTIPLTVHALQGAIKKYSSIDLTYDEILDNFGPVESVILNRFVPEDKGEEALDEYVRLFNVNFNAYVKPITGIKDLVAALKKQGKKIALYTGRSRRTSIIVLKNLGIEEYFEVIVSGDDVQKPKPHPEGIHIAAEKLGVKESECIYTGDFDVDIEASKAAGAYSVLALWSSTANEDLIQNEPHFYFRTPLEFVEFIK